MHSHLLISGLPRSLPPLPPSPGPHCLPCVEGWQRAALHSSSFPPTNAPLQTLHMDVWGPARVSGQGRECYYLLVVDDYARYTIVFPLRSKGEVLDVLIPWICAVRLQLCERFHQDLPVLRLHSDRGGEFSSNLLRDFCLGEGILQSFTLPASPQQNGIVERRICLVMEVAPQQLARVSLPETSPTLRWTGKVGDASVFRVWGSRAFVRDTSADNLSARAIPCVFLGFPPNAPGWQFYHPTSRRVLPSQDVTFDESVPFYRPPPVDPLPPHGPAPSRVSQVDPLLGAVPVEVALDSGAARGAATGGAASRGAEPTRAEPGGAEPEGAGFGGAEPGGAGPGGAEPEGVEPGVAESEGEESAGAKPEHTEPAGSSSTGGPSAEGTTAGDTGGGAAGGTGVAGPGGARTGRTGAAGAGVAAGVGARDRGAGDIPTPRSYAEAITVPPPWANIVNGMWIFRVKWPLGSPPAFKARHVGGGFSQRQGVDFFHTFSPTPKMTTVWVLLHVAAQRDYELHSLDFSTTFLQGSLHEEIWLRRPPGFSGSFPPGTCYNVSK
ncbi:unnamed protein product [Closterium sp. NIES-53]